MHGYEHQLMTRGSIVHLKHEYAIGWIKIE